MWRRCAARLLVTQQVHAPRADGGLGKRCGAGTGATRLPIWYSAPPSTSNSDLGDCCDDVAHLGLGSCWPAPVVPVCSAGIHHLHLRPPQLIAELCAFNVRLSLLYHRPMYIYFSCSARMYSKRSNKQQPHPTKPAALALAPAPAPGLPGPQPRAPRGARAAKTKHVAPVVGRWVGGQKRTRVGFFWSSRH
jgi:hypothetical protein